MQPMPDENTTPEPPDPPKPHELPDEERRILETLIADPKRIRCACGEPADTIHLLPWAQPRARIVAGCPSSDPGGYGPIEIDDLIHYWHDWREHIHKTKQDGDLVWKQIVLWLLKRAL
jgi:hypothetical protein